MANFTYRFLIEEDVYQDGIYVGTIGKHLRHDKEASRFIANLIEKTKDSIISSFSVALKSIVDHIDYSFSFVDGKMYCNLILVSKEGKHWSPNRRMLAGLELDGQLTDGIGECLDFAVLSKEGNTTYFLKI